jgi:hypothetical protein
MERRQRALIILPLLRKPKSSLSFDAQKKRLLFHLTFHLGSLLDIEQSKTTVIDIFYLTSNFDENQKKKDGNRPLLHACLSR